LPDEEDFLLVSNINSIACFKIIILQI